MAQRECGGRLAHRANTWPGTPHKQLPEHWHCVIRKNDTTLQQAFTDLSVHLFPSAFTVTQTGVNYCFLGAFSDLPVPYTDLVLNHQLSTFLQIFPSHFTNCFAKGSRNHWFQSFLLLGLGSKRPALPWNVGVLPLKVYNYQVSVMYERQNRLLTKVSILYMIVWKGGLQKSFWHPVFMLDKTWSNSLSSQPIFNGNSQEEIFYTKTCMYMCNRQKFCLWPTKNWFYDQLMSHNIWSKKCF